MIVYKSLEHLQKDIESDTTSLIIREAVREIGWNKTIYLDEVYEVLRTNFLQGIAVGLMRFVRNELDYEYREKVGSKTTMLCVIQSFEEFNEIYYSKTGQKLIEYICEQLKVEHVKADKFRLIEELGYEFKPATLPDLVAQVEMAYVNRNMLDDMAKEAVLNKESVLYPIAKFLQGEGISLDNLERVIVNIHQAIPTHCVHMYSENRDKAAVQHFGKYLIANGNDCFDYLK